MKPKEHDYLYELLFNISRVQTTPDYMYLACSKILDKERRRALIGQFVERICGENA